VGWGCRGTKNMCTCNKCKNYKKEGEKTVRKGMCMSQKKLKKLNVSLDI
jgi:hypothetical protein